ncbi:sensor histidine kinase [Maribellus sediminis]|uniref:sensor histidine kinase n=1 Tax=Maribellus sediminis TaxID=2696285 RepID=UPI001431F1F6|nr:histidine kinase [Maribellus sediminis]
MKRILTSIWFLALLITIPIIAMLPPVFSKYKITLDSIERKAGVNGTVYFHDLQNDGLLERVESFGAEQNLLAFHCYTENKLYNQFNFPYFYNNGLSRLFFVDADRDGLTDVYGFTMKEDSLFMSWNEPYDTDTEFHTFFVTTIDTRRSNFDVSVAQMEFFDFDGDGNKELVFSVLVGYNWFPRKLFVFHPDTEKLDTSEEFGVHFSALTPFDLGADGNKELLCVGSSADNITPETDVKYHDDRPRFFVFNSDLEPVYPPVEFPPGIASHIYYYFLDESRGEILALYHSYSSENNLTFATKVSLDGNGGDRDTLFFEGDLGKAVQFYRLSENNFILFSSGGRVFYFDRDLKIIKTRNLGFISENLIRAAFDLTGNTGLVYFTIDLKNQIHLFLEDLNDEIILKPDLGIDNSVMIAPSPVQNQFMVINSDHVQYYTLNSNPFFLLKYPFYLLVYFVIAYIIWMWQNARSRQLTEKYELQNQVRDLRLKSFRNQLNPHFIFNTFNGVASVIKKGDTEQAYEVFMRFSKMTRTLLDNFDDTLIPFEQEMDLVVNYLELQKFRFKQLFDYEIKVSDHKLNEIQIPRMMVQVHVENAVNHGLIPKGGNGLLKVDARLDGEVLRITIEDNGIGREQSSKMQRDSKGLGIKTIQSVVDEINAKGKHIIVQEIHDLKDGSENATGTRIELFIPIQLTDKT